MGRFVTIFGYNDGKGAGNQEKVVWGVDAEMRLAPQIRLSRKEMREGSLS